MKICGVRTADAIAAAVAGGADAVGFVFAPSPRRVGFAQARELADALPAFVARVAVLWKPLEKEVTEVLDAFQPDVLQCEPDCLGHPRRGARTGLLAVLHDDPDVLAQARALPREVTVLFESAGRGGRGAAPDWGRAAAIARERPLVLAGGLTPDNVTDAIRAVRPYGVDVSSGVESSPGTKDGRLIARFLDAVGRAGDGNDEGRRGTWGTVLGC